MASNLPEKSSDVTEPVSAAPDHTMHYYDGMPLPGIVTRKCLERVKDYNLEGDVAIVGYPKTGSTWLSEIIWLLCHYDEKDKASEIPIHVRVPYFETHFPNLPQSMMDMIENHPHPRIVHTHLPFRYYEKHLQEQQVKFVVPVRNPKDTLVSFYHFYRANIVLGKYTGTWNQFFDMFKANELIYDDYFDWYKAWWKHKDSPKVLFVKYEDMKKDLLKEVTRISNFLGKDLSEKEMNEIVHHCSFEEMSKNKMTNHKDIPKVIDKTISPFMRKGRVGDWTNYFTDAQSSFVDNMYKHLEDEGLMLEFSN